MQGSINLKGGGTPTQITQFLANLTPVREEDARTQFQGRWKPKAAKPIRLGVPFLHPGDKEIMTTNRLIRLKSTREGIQMRGQPPSMFLFRNPALEPHIIIMEQISNVTLNNSGGLELPSTRTIDYGDACWLAWLCLLVSLVLA